MRLKWLVSFLEVNETSNTLSIVRLIMLYSDIGDHRSYLCSESKDFTTKSTLIWIKLTGYSPVCRTRKIHSLKLIGWTPNVFRGFYCLNAKRLQLMEKEWGWRTEFDGLVMPRGDWKQTMVVSVQRTQRPGWKRLTGGAAIVSKDWTFQFHSLCLRSQQSEIIRS